VTRLQLLPSAPNPFNPATTIRYVLPAPTHVDVMIHDVHGRLVRRLLTAHQGAGPQAVHWDGRLHGGDLASSGTYVVRVVVGNASVAEKITLLK
jgi:flagellar hook assembly protein FlgD